MQASVDLRGPTAVVRFENGKVNALDPGALALLRRTFESLESDRAVRSIVFTGTGKFFSFGFDVPQFYDFSRDDFTAFLGDFTSLYAYLFGYPKPIIAAINGHAIAGGCMLAIACDVRLMVSGRARISLNEITFGASVFTGITEILRFWAGSRNATRILTSGAMYSAEEAQQLGIVDSVTTEEALMADAIAAAAAAERDGAAWPGMKRLLRRDVFDRIESDEARSIREFVEIWYSEGTRQLLRKIVIH